MNGPQRKIKIAMLQNGISVEDLMRETGLARGSLLNVIRGQARSANARQKITDYLRIGEIWPGIIPRGLIFAAGTLIHFPTAEETASYLRDVGDAGVEIAPNLVKLKADIFLQRSCTTPDSAPSEEETAAREAARQRGPAGIITIYDAQSEREAITDAHRVAAESEREATR